MCGVYASLRIDGAPTDSAVARAATRRLRHRGPDDESVLSHGPVSLGSTRLAVVDPDGGAQPFTSSCGRYVLVGNGEFYDAAALRARFIRQGVRFRSGSDVEVALAVFREGGVAAVQQLRGMFVLCIWDATMGELVVVRDRFGIKPAFWIRDGRMVHVASEPSALAAATGGLTVAEDVARWVLLYGYVPQPSTPFEQVHALPAGHVLRASTDGTISVRRGVPVSFGEPDPSDRATLVRATRRALDASVRAHLVADVPVGAFLSSGIDSAAIVALARQHRQLPTFSVGVADAAVDEATLAAATARALDVEHHSRHLGPDDIFAALPQVVRHLGPVADPSAVALWHLAALARESVKVVLSGEGADELFAGYRVYRQPGAARPVASLPPNLGRGLHRLAERLPTSLRGRGYLVRASQRTEDWYRGNTGGPPPALVGRLLGTSDPGPHPTFTASWQRASDLDAVRAMQTVDLHTWLPSEILAKADHVTMAHGLEARVPFLDPAVWEVARRVPSRANLTGGTTKAVLREAAADLLPVAVVRRSKLGFPVPVGRWLRGSHGVRLAERILGSSLGPRLAAPVLLDVITQHRHGGADHGRLLWALLVLATWTDEVQGWTAARPPTLAGVSGSDCS
jgi:asparagine synthase (glutamine-hydrolysing)